MNKNAKLQLAPRLFAKRNTKAPWRRYNTLKTTRVTNGSRKRIWSSPRDRNSVGHWRTSNICPRGRALTSRRHWLLSMIQPWWWNGSGMEDLFLKDTNSRLPMTLDTSLSTFFTLIRKTLELTCARQGTLLERLLPLASSASTVSVQINFYAKLNITLK